MRKVILLLLITVFLITVINTFSQGPSPTPLKASGNNQEKSSTKEQGTASNHYISSIAPSEIDTNISAAKTQEHTNNDATKSDNKTPSHWWTIIPTVVIAYFAIIQGIAMIFQYFAMQRQVLELKESIDIAKEATKATKEAAEAAKKSAEALPNIERAYIFIDSCIVEGMIPFNTEISEFEISVKLSNIGRTPAILTRLNCDTVWGIGYPIKYSEHDGTVVPHSWASLAAGEKMTYKIPIHVPKDILSKVILRELKLVCYGLIEYQDVWRDRHETEFCWEIIPYRDATLGYIVVGKSTLVSDSPMNKYT
jgi:hypothetical protein